ncbi:hypothetical protein FQR65_LT00090 [Abscondita terminalis]|nr:hypothetical protein FQR65_LT00090 [Abscondita terminalis]
MHLLKVAVLIIAFFYESYGELEAIAENVFTTRVSLSKCVREVSELFFDNGDLTIMALSSVESMYIINSSIPTDALLLSELFNSGTMTIIIKKIANNIFDESYIKKIDNYIIHVRVITEVAETLQMLKKYRTWNSQARYLIVSSNIFDEPKTVATSIIEELWKYYIINAVILLVNSKNETAFTAYSWFPYSKSRCTNNNNEIIEIDQCDSGTFRIGKNWYQNKIPRNLNGCTLRVQPVIWPPYVLPPKKNVFSEGVEIQLLNTMADEANFTIQYLTTNKTQNWGTIANNGSASETLLVLQNEKCDTVVGSFAATLERHKHFDYIIYNFPESLTWCVPHARDSYQWVKLFMVLPSSLIIYSYILCIIISIIIWRLSRCNPNESSTYKTLIGTMQNVFAVYFSMSVKIQPRSLRARFLFMLWVLFILHTTALYQSSLISVLTKPNYKQEIQTLTDILENNFNIWILPNMRRYFTENNEVNSKVKTVWKICEKIEKCLLHTSFTKKSTTCTPRLYLKYAVNHYVTKNGEPLLYCFKDSIVTYPLEMLFYKGFPLRRYFSELIGRIASAGLIAHWEKQILEHQLKHKSYSVHHPGDYQIAMSHLLLLFVYSKLDAIPENVLTARLSLSKCVAEVSELFFENGDLTLMALSSIESMYVINSSIATDALLLSEIFKRSITSLLIKKIDENVNVSYIKKVDNYIIHVRVIKEIVSTLQMLKKYGNWNSQARFLIISSNTFEEPKIAATLLIEEIWNHHILNAVVLLNNSKNKTLFSAYSWIPYSKSLCTIKNNEVIEIDQCDSGKFNVGRNWYQNKVPHNLNGCVLRAQPVIWPPYVLSPTNNTFLDGVEIKLLNTMAEEANFTINYIVTNATQNWGWIGNNGSALGSALMLLNEECDILVGSFAATLERHTYFDYVIYNFPESLTWCVPHARDAYPWLKLFMVLPSGIIIYSYFVCVIISLLIWWSSRCNHKEASTYKSIVSSMQNVFAVYFSMSVQIQPRCLRARFLFMLWVLFVLHISAIYQSSLISVLTKPNYKQKIETLSDILENNFDIWILPNMRRYFTENSDVNSKVKTAWKACDNIQTCLLHTSFSKKSVTATPRLYLKYAVNHYVTGNGEPLLYCFKDSIVTYPLEMLFYKGFPLIKNFEKLIGRIASAGLIAHWEKQILDYQLKHFSHPVQHPGDYKIAMSHLLLTFGILFLGYFVASIVFLLELYFFNRKNGMIKK